MSSVLGKRARTYSNPSTLTPKRAQPAKRRRTDQNSSTLNADKEIECPGKEPLPVATQDDTPKTPTKKPSPSPSPITVNPVFQLPTPTTTPSSSLTPYARARTLLRTSAASECTGRQTERDTIKAWIDKGESGLLYVSGGPGTGKTLIVNDTLQQAKVKFGYVNCTGMTSFGLLEAVESAAASTFKSILVVDELEYLAANEMRHLFETAATNRTRIVAISNTHTLTAKLPEPDDATTLHFSPYTADEMSAIIRVRLAPLMEEGIMVIQPPALTFVCKKVATQTGDLRACLSLLCQALATVEKMTQEKKSPSSTLIPVGMSDVIKASKATMVMAPTVGVKVKDLNVQSRLVLLTFLIASRRLTSGLSLLPSSSPRKATFTPTKQASITLSALHTLYESTLSAPGGIFTAVTWSEFIDVLGVLEVQGLLSVDDQAGFRTARTPSKRQTSWESSVSLPAGVRVDEVVKVLTAVEDAGAKEQEIRRMWEKQAFAIDKEAQRQRTGHAIKALAFEDAEEA